MTKNFSSGELALAVRAEDAHASAGGDERGRDAGGRDEVRRTVVAEDGVIAVVTIGDQRLAALLVFGQQAEAVAEIPAARALAEVAAHGRHVADLRAGGVFGDGGERRVVLADVGVVGEVGDASQRADAQPGARVVADAVQTGDRLDVDQALGGDDVVLHEREQVGAAGEQFGSPQFWREQSDGLLFGFGSGVFEGLHAAPPFFSSAARTRSGVRGRKGTRTPMALATALEMAAPGEITGGSPSPMTPRSS